METYEPPPEALLIERLRKALGGKREIAVARVAKLAGISEGRWRQIAKGYQQASKETRVKVTAPADTLARMGHIVGATPDQLRDVGRGDAADELESLMTVKETVDYNRSGGKSKRGLGAGLAKLFPLEATAITPYDEYFQRAERLMFHSHESARDGDYLGAIRGLEGAESTIELLIDRITDAAIQHDPQQENDDAVPGNQTAQSDASTEAETEEVSAVVGDGPKLPPFAAGSKWSREDSGVDGGEQGEQTHQL